MKKFLTILCITCMMTPCIMYDVAIAGTTTIKCIVIEVVQPILPENEGSIVMECYDLKDVEVGNKVKVKIKRDTGGAIEGC